MRLPRAVRAAAILGPAVVVMATAACGSGSDGGAQPELWAKDVPAPAAAVASDAAVVPRTSPDGPPWSAFGASWWVSGPPKDAATRTTLVVNLRPKEEPPRPDGPPKFAVYEADGRTETAGGATWTAFRLTDAATPWLPDGR